MTPTHGKSLTSRRIISCHLPPYGNSSVSELLLLSSCDPRHKPRVRCNKLDRLKEWQE